MLHALAVLHRDLDGYEAQYCQWAVICCGTSGLVLVEVGRCQAHLLHGMLAGLEDGGTRVQAVGCVHNGPLVWGCHQLLGHQHSVAEVPQVLAVEHLPI